MYEHRVMPIFRLMACLVVVAAAASTGVPPAQGVKDEQTVWSLEHAYWRYAQANDLTRYLALWHENFFGWPQSYPAPSHKNHITDLITSQTGKGLALKIIEFKPAGIQITGNLAATCYWVKLKWVNKDGGGVVSTNCFTHIWLKNGKDWQIISGMSMRERVTSQK